MYNHTDVSPRPLVSVLAQKYGKRPQFLLAAATGTLGTLLCLVGAAQATHGYRTLLAGRLVQGLGVTAWESLSLAAVGDLFYLHERGARTAVVVCSLACMASLVSMVGGVLFQDRGVRALFVAALPFDGVGLLATFFLLPETQFVRSSTKTSTSTRTRMRMAGEGRGQQVVVIQEEEEGCSGMKEDKEDNIKEEREHAQNVEEAQVPKPATTTTTTTTHVVPKKSYLQLLAPWSGTVYTTKSIPHLLGEILIHLVNPAVFWILMVSAVLVCFFVVSAYILSQLFSVAPYNLDVAANGYVWTGAFVGGLLAVGVGPLCDATARALARRNGGVFEAEFRLPVNVLGAAFVGLGWFLFMWVVDHPLLVPRGYLLGSFCHGCVCFGISVPSTSAGLYIL